MDRTVSSERVSRIQDVFKGFDMPLDRIYLADENGIASPAHPTALFIQRFLELAVVYAFQTSKYAMESTKRAISIEIANGKKYNKLFIG